MASDFINKCVDGVACLDAFYLLAPNQDGIGQGLMIASRAGGLLPAGQNGVRVILVQYEQVRQGTL